MQPGEFYPGNTSSRAGRFSNFSGIQEEGDLKASFRQCWKYSLFFIHLQLVPEGPDLIDIHNTL